MSICPYVSPPIRFLGNVISRLLFNIFSNFLVKIPLDNEHVFYNHFVRLSFVKSFATYGYIRPYLHKRIKSKVKKSSIFRAFCT